MEVWQERLKCGIDKIEKYLEWSAENSKGFNVNRHQLKDALKFLESRVFQRSDETDIETDALTNEIFKVVFVYDNNQLTARNLQLGLALCAAIEDQISLTTSEDTMLPAKISKFCGNPFEFRKFISYFSRQVEKNASLEDVRKLELLKENLDGEAFDLVDGIPVTPGSYGLALKLLENAYNDDELCVVDLHERLEAVPAAAGDDMAQLKRTYWKLESILMCLERYAVQTPVNVAFKRLYLSKFPAHVRAAITVGLEPTFAQVRKKIGKFVREKERQIWCEELGIPHGSLIKETKVEHGKSSALEDEAKEGGELAAALIAANIPFIGKNPPPILNNEIIIPDKFSDFTALVMLENTKIKGMIQTRMVFAPQKSSTDSASHPFLPDVYTGNLLAESAAKRLGLPVPQEKYWGRIDALGNYCVSSESTVEVSITVGNGVSKKIDAQIVRDHWCKKMYAPSVAEIEEDCPLLTADEELVEPGKGLLVEFLLSFQSASAYFGEMHEKEEDNWRVMLASEDVFVSKLM